MVYFVNHIYSVIVSMISDSIACNFIIDIIFLPCISFHISHYLRNSTITQVTCRMYPHTLMPTQKEKHTHTHTHTHSLPLPLPLLLAPALPLSLPLSQLQCLPTLPFLKLKAPTPLRENYRYVQYSTVQNSIVQYSTVQYSTVQYSTVQCRTV